MKKNLHTVNTYIPLIIHLTYFANVVFECHFNLMKGRCREPIMHECKVPLAFCHQAPPLPHTKIKASWDLTF